MKKTKKKMPKTEKQQQSKGITLVSLVVTIIVLIILAGISINLVLGDKGIITVAKKAKENTELAKIEEETQLNELYTQLEEDDGTLSYEPIEKLIEFREKIATAITKEGVETKQSDTADVMAENIGKIKDKVVQKGGTATEDKILKDYTAYKDGKLITGTMANNGAWTGTTTGAGNVSIPAGYHNGSGYVSGSGAYNQGVTDADSRVNTSSASYSTGYTNGYSAGVNTQNGKTKSGSASSTVIWNGWTSYGGVQSANHGVLTFKVSVTGNTATLDISSGTDSEYGIHHSMNIPLSE